MRLLTAPPEVVKQVFSHLISGYTIVLLYSTSISLRKYLPNKKILTHRLQYKVLGMFFEVGSQVVLDSPMVLGLTRLWLNMTPVEQEQFQRWIQGNRHRKCPTEHISVCLYDNGLFFYTHYWHLKYRVLKLLEPHLTREFYDPSSLPWMRNGVHSNSRGPYVTQYDSSSSMLRVWKRNV